ncbi:MAG: TonB C-terminal domain-containing protein [Rhodocyclaceae bacterium]|nr:TonB C-terminal domain-containing protein [Rhodocyclaceae bacterium]
MNDALHLDDRVSEPGKRAAAIMTVVVHVLLALFLIYGIRWQSSLPAAVEVELVSSVPAAAPRSEPKPETKPEVKPEPKVETPPPKPVVAPKPDIAIKEKPEKKPEPKPLFDPIKDMLKREAEQSNKDKLRDMLAKEEAASNASAAANASSKSKARYVDRISAKIRGNLMVPPGVSGNPEAEFRVNQLPTGEVIEVKLRKSSGNRALDEAIERAIYKSSPLPKPERNEDFDRALDLKFKPLEQGTPN